MIEFLIWIFIPTFISYIARWNMPILMIIPIAWSFNALVIKQTRRDYERLKPPEGE